MSSSVWAERELQSLQLGDRRLHPRLVHILNTLIQHPQSSIPEAFGNWADTKAFYRFCSSDNVRGDQIDSAHLHQTRARILSHKRILAIQDKTQLDFTSHKATTGLGPIGSQANQGFLVHSVLAASDTGLPLGMLKQFVWSRDPQTRGQGEDCRSRPLEDKETICWCFGLKDSENSVPDT